jgi:hypothetical protein
MMPENSGRSALPHEPHRTAGMYQLPSGRCVSRPVPHNQSFIAPQCVHLRDSNVEDGHRGGLTRAPRGSDAPVQPQQPVEGRSACGHAGVPHREEQASSPRIGARPLCQDE